MSDNTQQYDALDDWQLKAIDVAYATSSILSILGSAMLLFLIYRDTKLATVSITSQHRFLIGLSIFDILGSARHFISVFVNPTEPSAACTYLGFWSAMNFVSPMYTVVLSFFFFRIIHGASAKAFAKRCEKYCHIIAIGYPLVIAIMGLVWEAYNPGKDGSGCIASDYPPGCAESDIECIRGQNSYLFRVAGYGIAVVSIFLALIYLNVRIFLHVYSLERKSKRFNLSGGVYRKSRMVAIQNILYVLAFVLTYIFGPIILIVEAIKPEGFNSSVYFALVMCLDTLFPLQGALNFFIYIRPRYKSFRLQAKGTSLNRDTSSGTNGTPVTSRVEPVEDILAIHQEKADKDMEDGPTDLSNSTEDALAPVTGAGEPLGLNTH